MKTLLKTSAAIGAALGLSLGSGLALAQPAPPPTAQPPSPPAGVTNPSPATPAPSSPPPATSSPSAQAQPGEPEGTATGAGAQTGGTAQSGGQTEGTEPEKTRPHHAASEGARAGHEPGEGGSEPSSARASNINDSDKHGNIAPRLPTPHVGQDANARAFLDDAQAALEHHRTGEAQEALERAETRLMDHAESNGSTGPENQPVVEHVEKARQALAKDDISGAESHVREALTALGGGQGPSSASSSTSSTSATETETTPAEPARPSGSTAGKTRTDSAPPAAGVNPDAAGTTSQNEARTPESH